MASRAKPAQAKMVPKKPNVAVEARLAEALEQQAATSDILRLMASSPGDVQPVLDAVARWATRLCRSPFARVIMLVEGELKVVAHHSVAGEAAVPVLPIALGRTSITGRAVLDRETVHYADLLPVLDTEFPEARSNIELLGARAVLAVPLAREGDVRGAIFLWRRDPGLFPPDQVALVQTFARQAAIAIENVRRFNEVAVSNRELTEALEQQTATSEILRVISRSHTDVQPVFETIVDAAMKLCNATSANVFTYDGVLIHIVAVRNVDAAYRDRLLRQYPKPPGRESGVSRAVMLRSVVIIPDVLAEPDYDPAISELAASGGFRSVLAIPLLRDGNPVGAIAVGKAETGPFPERQVALLQTFADQAVIAIENVRLFTELGDRNRDLSEALEQQEATSNILRAISGSPTDATPVFETIAANALRLCDAAFSVCYRFDGELIHIAALHHVKPEGVAAFHAAYPCPPGRGGITQRAILTGHVVHVADVRRDPEYVYHDAAKSADYRSVLSVPMLRDGRPIGAITVFREVPRLFPHTQIALLQTFADQAVIAIGNVRLFTEVEARNRDLSEALEQQEATSEILRAIAGSPTDIRPVLGAVVHAAARYCGAPDVLLMRVDNMVLRGAAAVGPFGDVLRERSGSIDAMEVPLTRDSVSGRAAVEHRSIHVHDLAAESEDEYPVGRELQRRYGHRTIVAVPLLREGATVGVIVLFRTEVKPFSGRQLELVRTFADQAVIAIENVRLFTELDARNRDLTEALEQQTATSEILRVISGSPTDVQPVFDIIGESAERLCDAEISVVSRLDGEHIRLIAVHGVTTEGTETIGRHFPMRRDAETVTARAIRNRAVVHVEDVLADSDYAAKDAAVAGGYRACLGVPMVREDEVIGAIFVARTAPGLFADSQVLLLKTFADQAVIAIENVRLFNELKARTTELTQSVGELKALGEVGQAVSSTLDLDTVLRTIVARATQLAGADGGAIYEYDNVRGEFHLRTAERYADELIDILRAKPIRKGEGALGRLALLAEPVQISDIGRDRTYRSRVREVLLRLGYRSVLSIPLVREDHLLGGLVVNRATTGEFAPQVIELLKTFATQSALAIQNARLFREIGDKSRELEIASRHKSEFLANMSHELRTPLNAIIGFSEVLADQMFGEVNAKQAEYLADILESGRHLLSLINDILDLSKIEAGRMELDLGDFSLPSAIDNTVTLVRERAHRRNITLERALDEGVGPIRADERKVKQVLLNLLSNALKFTPEGGRISVRANVRNGMTEVSVTDTGVGISPQDQATVFEEFRQVGTMSKQVEGTGLGLAISRKFIELHGGKIWVTSEVGVGSTFAFTLPHAIGS